MASENPSQQMPNPALQHPMPDQAQPMLNPQMVPNPAQIAVNPVNVGVGVPFQSASLYVGDLHPDVTDALLYDIFNAVGPIASIRVCRDAVTRRSLGYAYVNFHNPNDAERALDTMNYTMIKDRPCRIMWSQRDPSLRKTGAGNVFVKHLDLSIDNKALFDTFSLFGNILSCKVVTDSTGKSRGYGFVHFETTEAADEAIKKINGMEIAGKEVFVGKFLKKSDRPSAKDWTNVYVKNIPKSWGKDQLEDFFADCGAISSSVVMTDSDGVSKGFGFVDFVEHEGAEKACEDFNDFELEVDRKEVVDTDSYNYEEDYQNEHDEYVPKPKADEPEINKESTEDPDSADKENAHSENENDIGKEKDVRDGKKGESQTVKLKLMVCRAQRREERERELSRKFEAIKMEKQNKYVGVNLFIKNLDDRVDDEILRKEFEPYGGITSARVMREKLNSKEGNKLGPSKGFGFVCFSAPEEAVKAVTEMNGKLVFGKPIYVALAQRKEERRAQLEAQHRQHQRIMSVPPQMFFNQMNPNMNVPNINGMNNMNVSVPNMNMNMQNMPNFPRMNNFNMPPMMQQVPQQQGQAQAGQGQPRANAKAFLQPTQNPRGPVPQMRSMNPNMMMMPQQNQARAPNQNMNVQFNQNARNTGMGGMPPRQFQTGMRMPNQGPIQMGNRQDQPLTSTVLANASPEERKAMIGEKLYPMVQRLSNRDVAAKITGMLLEMENAELLHLLESPDSLISKVNEALEVLQSAAQSHPQK